MAMGGPNPGLWGDSVRNALNPDEKRDANDNKTGAERALLDKADLQELERTGVYGETPEAAQPPRRRALGFLAQIFRRSA
jgi:hypothetical protein